jgi:predicted  nucleic acid-binding Zn-ribbon protein
MAPANNKTALKAEIERKLEKENLERRLRLERERKPTEVPGVKIPQFLTRNALAKGLTNLGVPDLLPLRDAMMSLSDPGFLNKKFNQDVYRELPQRVKDFIALPANQVTRAVIISKIIEAVKLAKKNANNANFNRGVAKALTNLAPKPKNNKPRVATTNAGTNAKPVTTTNTGTNANGPVTTTNAGTNAKPANTGVNVATQANNLTNKIANLQDRLNKAQENAAVAAAEQKAEANAKVAELTKSLNETTNALERQRTDAEKMVANLRAERNALSGATNAEKANLTKQLANAKKDLNLKNKVIALTRARAAVSKKKLAANKEAALREVNKYKKDFAIATNTLENLKKKGVANKQQINNLETQIGKLKKSLSILEIKRIVQTSGLRERIKKLESELQKLKKPNQPVQNTGNNGKNNFRRKVQATINSGVSNGNKVELEKIISRINTTNLITLERNYADVIGKPRIYLFLNQFKNNKNQFISAPSGIEGVALSGTENNARKSSTEKIKEIIKTYGDNKVNLFFTGPSGSGKTTMFQSYLASKNMNINNTRVTAYYPTFKYNLDGTLTINDAIEEMPYSKFVENFIRPTPFNKTSSRAHMSVQVGDVTVFDLAGTENPLAIMWNSLGFNIFETKFWGFANQSFDTIYDQRGDAVELYSAIFGSNAPYKKLEGLDEMAALFIYWNFARRPGIIKKATSKATTLAARFMGKKPGTFNDIKTIMQYDPTVKTEGGKTYGKWMFESIKRVFEGFYITRSLFSLKLLFSKSKYYNKNIANGFKNMASQEIGTILPGKNNSNNGFSVKLKDLKGARRLTNGTLVGGTIEASQFVKSLSGIKQNASGKFLILDKANPSYTTKLLQSTKASGNKNCIIGVVNANPAIENSKRSQQKTAVEYLQSLQK